MLSSASGLQASTAGQDLGESVAEYLDLLDGCLRDLVSGAPPFDRLYQMMAYHLGWLDSGLHPCRADIGKRIRPSLCFLACRSVGGATASALPGAMAVELVHNFSLVHDDIEDDSPLRRHRPAVWSIWGIPQAINTGDGLFCLAHLALLEGCDGAHVPTAATINHAAVRLGRACISLCEGQFLDLHLQSAGSIDMVQYRAMVERKAGALFGCAMELGALLGGASTSLVAELGRFGRALGVAFQMQDDLLGVWGDELRTGKVAQDVRDRKRGLPVAIAWEHASGRAFDELCRLYAGRAPMSDAEVARTMELFERLDVRGLARTAVGDQLALTSDMLEGAATPEPGKTLLRRFVAGLVDRES